MLFLITTAIALFLPNGLLRLEGIGPESCGLYRFLRYGLVFS
ncbi:MAG: hypothetical protein WC466_01550 [Candidatus Izemoplasmatales bacterium]